MVLIQESSEIRFLEDFISVASICSDLLIDFTSKVTVSLLVSQHRKIARWVLKVIFPKSNCLTYNQESSAQKNQSVNWMCQNPKP